jgi:hypothetical protein
MRFLATSARSRFTAPMSVSPRVAKCLRLILGTNYSGRGEPGGGQAGYGRMARPPMAVLVALVAGLALRTGDPAADCAHGLVL